MRSMLRAMLLSAGLFTFGCAVGTHDTFDEDEITEEELREGESYTGGDGHEPDDATDDGQSVSDLEDTETDEFGAQHACNRATGYRRGVRFSICVTRVDGKWVEVKTAQAFLRMRAAAARAGVRIRVVSGFRTMAKQRELYRCYKARRCPLAAPPGFSNHQSGHALDLNTSSPGVYSWLSRHGGAYGFRRTVPSERWHWEKW